MNAHHRPTEAQIDPGTSRTTLAAGQLLAQIELAYPGSVQSYDNQTVTLHLFTVKATANASTINLLRAWQNAARLRLEAGVR